MESQAVEKTQSIVTFESQTMQTQVHNEGSKRMTPFLNPHGKTMNRIAYEGNQRFGVEKVVFQLGRTTKNFECLDFQMLNHPGATIPHTIAFCMTPLCYILEFSGLARFGKNSKVVTLIL
jgi:hypothetical protein